MAIGHRVRPPEPEPVVKVDLDSLARLLVPDDLRARACRVLGHDPATYPRCPATVAELLTQALDRIEGQPTKESHHA